MRLGGVSASDCSDLRPCTWLVRVDEANPTSISGDVDDHQSDAPYEWKIAWGSDDDVNEFSITVGDDPADEYLAFETFRDRMRRLTRAK
jgi:hypothetical protein